MSLPDDRLLTCKELATRLHLSERTILRRVGEGMPSYKIGRSRRYALPEIEQWLGASHGNSLDVEDVPDGPERDSTRATGDKRRARDPAQ